jgi:hypothetical protein
VGNNDEEMDNGDEDEKPKDFMNNENGQIIAE